MKHALGFDPGINISCWAVVSEDGTVYAGAVRPKHGDHVAWAKAANMINAIQDHFDAEVLPYVPPIDIFVCEGQYSRAGRGTQDHNIRLGWLSSIVYGMAYPGVRREIALPQVWTRGKPKECREPEVLGAVDNIDDWHWLSAVPPPSLMHNVIDAVGLALYGLKGIQNE